MKRTWLAVVAWVACGMAWPAAPALAQTSVPGMVQVEQYRGLRRVDYEQRFEPADPTVQPVEARNAGTLGLVTMDLPAISPEGLPVLETKTAPPSRAADLAPAPSQADEAAPKELAQRLPVRNQGDAGAGTAQWYQEEWLHAATTLAAPLLPTLLVLMFLMVLARRLKAQQGPLIRVEHVGGQHGIAYKDLAALMFGPGAREPAGAGTPLGQDAPSTAEPPTTSQAFELGPTLEEERAAKEQETHNREQGMLQHLFDENMKLRNQLKDPESAAAGSASQDTPAAGAPLFNHAKGSGAQKSVLAA
jgi:hypothetical protein